MASSTESLQTSRTEINELKRTLQALQIELQSQLSLVSPTSTNSQLHRGKTLLSSLFFSFFFWQKEALEGQLVETESRYSLHLSQLQAVVNELENELCKMRADIQRQGQDYQALLDIKNRLEREIAEYRRLLDGEEVM